MLGASATSDARWIAFSGQSGNLYLWDSSTMAVVYTNNSSPASVVAISPDGKRLVYGVTNWLFALDWAAGLPWQIGPALSGSRIGLRFSSDGRWV